MTLVKWSPFRNLDVWDRDLHSTWQQFNLLPWNEWLDKAENLDWVPAADLQENKNGYTLEVELPGVRKEDVKIDLQEKVLTIRGEKKSETEKQEGGWQRVERTYGAFARSFRLPDQVNAEQVKADYQNGVLRLELPKAEHVKPREIQIK